VIREYRIVIDTKNRAILHDCADWSKMAPTKRLCKHVGKLLLTLDRKKATSILRELHKDVDSWRFGLLSEPSTERA
jgi:hypothetical protein